VKDPPGKHRSSRNSTGNALILNGRLVPEAEVNLGILNGSYRDTVIQVQHSVSLTVPEAKTNRQLSRTYLFSLA